MQKNRFKPSTLVIHYCFAMVLAGCVGVSLNKKLLDQDNTANPPIELTAETTTTSSAPEPTRAAMAANAETQASTSERQAAADEDKLNWDACPTHDDVKTSIKQCRKLIAATSKIAADIHNGSSGRNENAMEMALNRRRDEADVWKSRNDSILNNCSCLLGATGYPVYPEIPLALQNLKHAGKWLDWSIAAEQFGEHKEALEYIAAANRAATQASKLINHKIRPKLRTALVKLPKHLEKFSISSL